MAKFQKNEKRGPVPHKVLTDRGVYLEQRHTATQNSSIHHGKSAVIGQKDDGSDIVAKIGQKCPNCRFRVRGVNHAEGAHHRGMVHQGSRR